LDTVWNLQMWIRFTCGFNSDDIPNTYRSAPPRSPLPFTYAENEIPTTRSWRQQLKIKIQGHLISGHALREIGCLMLEIT